MTGQSGACPRFSVIVPVYNAARYLPACLDSLLLQQDAPPFELLLIDDGSTDESGALIDRCAAEHPGRVAALHTANQGPILARREGIVRARGEYLLFADADDLLRRDCLAVVDARLRETGADLLIYNFAAFDEGAAPVTEPPVFPDGSVFEGADKRAVYGALIDSWRLNNLWFKAIRRQLMQADDTDYSAFSDNPMGDDLLMSLYPVTEASRIAYCSAPLYLYRNAPGSLTRRLDDLRYRRLCDARVMEQLCRYMARWGMDGEDWQTALFARMLCARIDACLSFFRRAEDAAARRQVLARDWFLNLPADRARRRAALRRLPPRQRIQYRCIRLRAAGLIYRLLRLASGRKG